MAREEFDREDLLREATALLERIELAPAKDDVGEHVVVGFRDSGAASVYLGGDAAYHFNANGELRRAYRDGLLYKAERGVLVSLKRIRGELEVQLVRRPLPRVEQAAFLATMLDQLRTLAERCRQGELVSVGQVPDDVDVIGRVRAWLGQCTGIAVAASPHAG